MEVLFKKSFIRDFEKLPEDIKARVRDICMDVFPELRELSHFESASLKKLKGFRSYYRIRVGSYRIGFKKEENRVVFMRVLHRKDIYRRFP